MKGSLMPEAIEGKDRLFDNKESALGYAKWETLNPLPREGHAEEDLAILADFRKALSELQLTINQKEV